MVSRTAGLFMKKNVPFSINPGDWRRSKNLRFFVAKNVFFRRVSIHIIWKKHPRFFTKKMVIFDWMDTPHKSPTTRPPLVYLEEAPFSCRGAISQGMPTFATPINTLTPSRVY